MTPRRRNSLWTLLALLGSISLAPAQNPGPKKPTADKVTKPKAQNPKAQKPKAQKPKAQKPKAQKPKAQKPKAASPPQAPIAYFTAPDGSRFILAHSPGMPMVFWAIATWADGSDDPLNLPGLAETTSESSLLGTWATGSNDPVTERKTLEALDQARQRQLQSPKQGQHAADIARLTLEASKLSDTREFMRVLAATPARNIDIENRFPVTVFTLSTIQPALLNVAKLIRERREEQPLRELIQTWRNNVSVRKGKHGQDPRWRLHAEALSLLIPASPTITRMEPPPMAAPTLAQALATWQSSQHPTRTVHVLLGGIDLKKTQTMLESVFSSTSLPAPTPRQTRPSRPPQSRRRSIVPGIQQGGAVFAWVLPTKYDPWALATGINYFIESENSTLRKKLRKKRPNLILDCRAPWPPAKNGRSLLLLDVIDPSGKPDLVEDVLAACAGIPDKQRPDGHFYSSYQKMRAQWHEIANDPRAVAISMAERALTWPDLKVTTQSRPQSSAKDIYHVMKTVFQSQPAIVEATK